ncbi:hypothetical protein V9T40_010200 [Parthenolecanium corni]|uniref:Aladin seven-bladed propeller domain-containing protein n=1 Tax=Parthenolecanium corni TaxID=536013 RepID=A0AAN9TC89_9HEMI
MLSLSRFSDFQENGHVATCEVDGKVKYCMPSETDTTISRLVPFVSGLPNVSFPDGSISNKSAKYTAASPKELFLSPEDTRWSKIKTAWFEKGLLSAILVSFETQLQDNFRILSKTSQWFSRFYGKYFSRVNVEGHEDVILPEYCSCKNWKNGIRCVKWHPHCNKFAIVSAKDEVHVYSTGSSFTSVLKHRKQQYITCIAWRPLSASDLAVGCSEGVYVWNIEPNSIVTRPSITCATLLSKPGHKYVTSVSWNQQGNLLVSASVCDRTMYVWDVSMEVAVPLQKYGGGIPVLVSWSPTSEHVFASTTNILFRIWSSVTWTCDNWYTGSSRVKCVCWSADGSVLLFTTTTEPIIYAIMVSSAFNLFSNSVSGNGSAICVADLSKQELPNGDLLGGTIVDMTWDSSGKLLAVIFKDSNLIPVFSTTICARPKVLQLSPRCLIRGRLNESPNCIDFQKNLKNGTNLTIAWSSGRIQYFPFYSSENSTFV